jgi:hypothetical protein
MPLYLMPLPAKNIFAGRLRSGNCLVELFILTTTKEHHRMIHGYVKEIAEQNGVAVDSITLLDGERIGVLDAYLMKLHCNGHMVSTLLFKKELDAIKDGQVSERFQREIAKALTRLHVLSGSELA